MGRVIFNGVSSEDLNLVVQTQPTYAFPEADYSSNHVSGKNGNLIITHNSFKNVERTYYFAVAFRGGTKFYENASKINAWLHSAKGYARLEDSYEPDYYRMAAYHDNGSFTNYYDEATAIAVTFDCKPQRYLKSGEIKHTVTRSAETYDLLLVNPTNYIALPKIYFNNINSSSADITVLTINTDISSQEQEIVIQGVCPSGFIDSELKDCIKTTNGNYVGYYNDKIIFNQDFPILYPGNNYIKIELANNANTEFIIEPRWWLL